ncbi:competence type IV pilus minor pilin ComGG [Neobacillus mesonae]|uniref:competence type IV pilus minor pilin ComGG n=1 Tax=Neobacillus mesonae TaxID=1193713 RepID=UPI00203F6443|nr:competence type IV pilus minor pilin ComGG [Neobacillus mesonae]MCM3566627.1 ComGG family competence protein [Neobacillus mesonae]
MNNSEKGFTYPFTLCLLILFLLFFSMNVERLLSERKLMHETETIQQQEYYFLSTVKKLENRLVSEGVIPTKGTIQFQEGIMNFQAEPPSGSSQTVNFTLSLKSGITALGSGVFDTESKKLIKWIESQ